MEMKEKKEIVTFVIDELEQRGLIDKCDNLKDKTKSLLKNFNRLDNAIKHYQKSIKNLESSKNTTSGGPMFKSSKTDLITSSTADNSSLDVIESRINNLKQTIVKIEVFKTMINDIISDKLKKEDQDILKKVYFEGVNADDIAIELNCDKSTIYRRISKALEDIKIELFASDFIDLMS